MNKYLTCVRWIFDYWELLFGKAHSHLVLALIKLTFDYEPRKPNFRSFFSTENRKWFSIFFDQSIIKYSLLCVHFPDIKNI